MTRSAFRTLAQHAGACAVAGALATGCAANMTREGAMVREISGPAAAASCKFLGIVDAYEGMGLDVGDDRRGAMNRLRNKVGALGGDAYVLVQSPDSSLMGTTVQAEAYRCAAPVETREAVMPGSST